MNHTTRATTGHIVEKSPSERGSALVLAIFVLAIVGAMGVALMAMSSTEVKMSHSSLRLKKAFYMAEAGEETGRTVLHAVNGTGDLSDDLVAHAGPNGVFDVDPDALAGVWDADGNLVGLTGYGDDVPLRDITAFGTGFYAAFLSNDPVEGRTTTVDGNQSVMVTAVGAGENRSLEIVEAILLKEDLLNGLPPATVTLLGPSPVFEGPHSDVHQFSGDDCTGTGYVPTVGLVGADAEASAETGIYYDEDDPSKHPDYDSGPYSMEDTFADLTDPGEPTLGGGGPGLDPMWTDCLQVQELLEDLKRAADAVCQEDETCTPPAGIAWPTIYNEGDYEIGPAGGQGTLVVTGELVYDGRADWLGMVLVLGEGNFRRNGSGNGMISGGIIVADIAGPDEIYGTADDCSGGDGGFGSVNFEYNGGGNGDTTYCSDHIIAARPNPPYRITSFRQD